MLGALLAGMGMEQRLGVQIDKGEKIGPGPEDLPGPGLPFRDLLGIGFGPLHSGIAQIGNGHVDGGRVPVSSSMDQVRQL